MLYHVTMQVAVPADMHPGETERIKKAEKAQEHSGRGQGLSDDPA
jgi:muconolactone delta-isomerase